MHIVGAVLKECINEAMYEAVYMVRIARGAVRSGSDRVLTWLVWLRIHGTVCFASP